jgi:hypothetical protein
MTQFDAAPPSHPALQVLIAPEIAFFSALMIVATVLTGTASAWSVLQPLAFRALGFEENVHRGE